MSHASRRRQFIAGRVVARKLIASLCNQSAAHALIDLSATGKPFMADRADLHFSISHSGNWVACAVANVPVGLDIERIDAKRSTSELIDEVCSEAEQLLLQGLPCDRRDRLFTELWTLKEAWLKRHGLALDVGHMRAIAWTTSAPPDSNCASWITSDALAVSVAGPCARNLLSQLPFALGSAQCTTRRVEDA